MGGLWQCVKLCEMFKSRIKGEEKERVKVEHKHEKAEVRISWVDCV